MSDLISRQAAIDAFEDTTYTKKRNSQKDNRVAIRTVRDYTKTSNWI